MTDPLEPTEGMIYAGAMIIADQNDTAAPDIARRIWRAMMQAKMIQGAREMQSECRAFTKGVNGVIPAFATDFLEQGK